MIEYALNGKPCSQAQFEAAAGGTLYDTIRLAPEGPQPKYRDRVPEDDHYDVDEVYGWNLRSPLLDTDYETILRILRNTGDSPNALVDALAEAGYTLVK